MDGAAGGVRTAVVTAVKQYCVAYQMKELRAFDGWTEHSKEQASDLTDDDVVYVCDDFTVVRSPVGAHESRLMEAEASTAQWREFCSSTLLLKQGRNLRTPPA